MIFCQFFLRVKSIDIAMNTYQISICCLRSTTATAACNHVVNFVTADLLSEMLLRFLQYR